MENPIMQNAASWPLVILKIGTTTNPNVMPQSSNIAPFAFSHLWQYQINAYSNRATANKPSAMLPSQMMKRLLYVLPSVTLPILLVNIGCSTRLSTASVAHPIIGMT